MHQIDDASARELEKLEAISARGRRHFLLRQSVFPSAVVLLYSLVLLWFKNPYWYWIPLLSPVYLGIGLLIGIKSWSIIPARIEKIRAGRTVRMPARIREAFWLYFGGIAVLLLTTFVSLLSPIEQEFLVMALLAGAVVSIWGLARYSLLVLRTPRGDRTANSNLLLVIALWFLFVFIILFAIAGVFKDFIFNWLIGHLLTGPTMK